MTEYKSKNIEPGDLLVATPHGRPTGPFYRTVVLICMHGTDGSVGLIINRPTSVTLDHLVEKPLDEYMVHYGGPVELECLTYLHQHGGEIHEAHPVTEDIFFCGNFDDTVRVARDRQIAPIYIRFFAGYSGWAAGQLEDELQQGYWFLTQGTTDLVFWHEPKNLWRLVLRKMGGEYAILANFPHDPTLN